MIKIKLNNYDENVDKLSNKIKTLVIDNQTSINILGQESKKNSVYNYQENLRMVREMRNKNNRDFLQDEIRNMFNLWYSNKQGITITFQQKEL